MPKRKKIKVFVSYSRHDEALVKPLAGLLGVAAKDAVFLDVEQLEPGDLWEQRIVEAIRESSVFVVCWCCHSRDSGFVAKEIDLAAADEGKILVPVLFCYTRLPDELSNRQWIDMRGKVAHECDHRAYIGDMSGSSVLGRVAPSILYQEAHPLRKTAPDAIVGCVRRYFESIAQKR